MGIHNLVYDEPAEKPLVWVGASKDVVRSFPEPARRRTGFELNQVQIGCSPTDWRPMPSVGPGVIELRVHAAGEHRVFYVARFEEAVYVLHAFEKKSEKTPQRDIDVGRTRLAWVRAERRSNGER